MKVCVYGAGAIGGHIAVMLARAGNDVSVVVRGAHGEAVAANGLTLLKGEERLHAKVRAHNDPAQLGEQDVVFVTVKATVLPALAGTFDPLLKPDTPIVFALNGIPWWYSLKAPPAPTPLPELDMLDPGGRLAASVDIDRVIGCVVRSGNEVVEPGVVRNSTIDRNLFTIGELDGDVGGRITAIGGMLEFAGLQAPVVDNIREALWTKLVTGNMVQTSLCSIVRSPLSAFADAELRDLRREMMLEGIAIARAYSIELDLPFEVPERTISSQHRPSMLQDIELGRPVETDAILAAPRRLARAAGIATPHLDTVAILLSHIAAKARASSRG